MMLKKRHALIGHVVRLDSSVPAHQALKQVIAMKAGRCSGMNWRRLPGRPRKTLIQQIGDGTTTSWKQMAECRGTCRGEPSQRTTAVYASWASDFSGLKSCPNVSKAFFNSGDKLFRDDGPAAEKLREQKPTTSWNCRTQSLESSSSGHMCDRHCQCL